MNTLNNPLNIQHQLKNIPVHDASFKSINYNYEDKTIEIVLDNHYENKIIYYLFKGIKVFLSSAFEPWGDNAMEINAFVFLKEAEVLKPLIENIDTSNLLHFEFEMFTGNQIHILCEDAYYSVYNIEPEVS